MKRWLVIFVTAVAACGSQFEPPEIAVDVRDPCDDLDGDMPDGDSTNETADESCSCYIAGSSLIEVSTRLKTKFNSGQAKLRPVVWAQFSNAEQKLGELTWVSSCDEEICYEKTFRIPYSGDDTMVLRVEVGDYLGFSETIPLCPPELKMTTELLGWTASQGDEDPTCAGANEVAGGLYSAKVAVEAPVGLAGDLMVYDTFDGVRDSSSGRVLAKKYQTADLLVFEGTRDVPVRTTCNWSLEAQLADLLVASDMTWSIRSPKPVRMGIFASPPAEDIILSGEPIFPSRIAGEPDAACRRLYLVFETPDPPKSRRLTVETSLGKFPGGASTETLEVQEGSMGWRGIIELTLPDDSSKFGIEIKASSEGLPARAWQFELGQALPIGAFLLATNTQISVGMNGSASAQVSGKVTFEGEEQGEVHEVSPGTKVAVVARADTDPDALLECAPSLASTLLDCDPYSLNSGVSEGGCVLTPPTVAVGQDGSIEIPVQSSLCFAGNVEIELWAFNARDPIDDCIGSGALIAPEGPLASVSINYVPSP
ncbi:hypothetical protein ACNOYE_08265 [Nannocystaceae bacterium ST9]